jgi:hypothetical protein
MSNSPQNLHILLNEKLPFWARFLMIGHTFGSGYHLTLVKLFGGHSSTTEASLQRSILEASVFIQQIISKWPASEGGQLPDLIQYGN